MIATQDLIDQALAKLRAALPELEVDHYPANPATFRLNHPLGAVLLAYPGSNSTGTMLMGRVEQVRTVRLGLTLVTRQLWGDDGAATLLDRLRTALVGWRPEDCEPVVALGDRLLQEDAGLWWYAAEFACNTRLIVPIHA
ncbi:MAG TPA: Gp37 family protein [Burkholderiaceae bacterium]|nr:Gp37 family protein [Burkholderiaceae bacterium]